MFQKYFYRLILTLLLVSAASYAGDWTGNINAFMGLKALDSEDWSDEFQEQTEGGILFDIQKKDWPVCAVIESMYSMDEDEILGVEFDVSTTELFLGVGKTWKPNSTIRPYVRAGINFASIDQKVTSGYESHTFDESGTGYAISGGVYWTISQHFNLGLGARYSKANIDFGNFEAEAGGTHSGLVIGYHW